MAEARAGAVLLVEDDEALATVLARHLSAHGFATVVAPSAEDAERRLGAGLRPSLVLLDINLPGETGWGFLRGPAYEAAGAPPVVVVSATHVPSSRLRASGAAGYLPKPFAMETLVDVVERFTRGIAAGADEGARDG